MGKKYNNRVGSRYGRKNLQYLEGGKIKNQFGVVFTDKEKRALESAVTQANRKRAKQLKEYATLPRMVRGVDTGDTLASKLEMGYDNDSDFIITKKTKSLQRFTSREQFNKYMRYLKTVNSDKYIDERTRLYKRNYIKAIENVHGEEANDIKMKIRMMKPAEFRKMIEQDELIEINEIYDEVDKIANRERMRLQYGMKSKEDIDIYTRAKVIAREDLRKSYKMKPKEIYVEDW